MEGVHHHVHGVLQECVHHPVHGVHHQTPVTDRQPDSLPACSVKAIAIVSATVGFNQTVLINSGAASFVTFIPVSEPEMIETLVQCNIQI